MKKATSKKKNMTIDELAVMVAKGFSALEDKISGVEDKMATKDEMDRKFAEVEKTLNKIRMDMLDMGDRFVSNHRFDELVSRFNILEAKVKGKK